MTGPHAEGNRNALLDFYFQECDPQRAAAIRAHVEGCAACREYLEMLGRVEGALRAWADEAPPVDLGRRVLEALPPRPLRRVPPARRPDPEASALLSLIPAMALLVAAVRWAGGWLAASAYWPQLEKWTALHALGAWGVAALLLLALGGLAALAVAPALVFESRRHARPSPA